MSGKNSLLNSLVELTKKSLKLGLKLLLIFFTVNNVLFQKRTVSFMGSMIETHE